MSGSITQGADLTADVELSCDVCVIGSGAGGSVLAAGLCERGLDVVLLEEGGYFTRRDFDLDEQKAFPMLYQDRGTRGTADLAITVLQGRSVGGTTTVNWTTCFRTPERVLRHWEQVHRIEGLDSATLSPHWDEIERRLSIHPWPEALANDNNRKLLDGARALGWAAEPLKRNVKGCADSGYCGVGCPVNGKQAMHITYIPDAVVAGLRLYADVRADRIQIDGDRATAVHASVLDRDNGRATGVELTVKPKVVALCGGAINSPATLLRSGIDQGGLVGRRTFIHPVVGIAGVYTEPVNPFFGAPQSIGSHHFVDRGTDKVGFFFESAPLQPMLASLTTSLMGQTHADFMAQLPKLGVMIGLMVDGLLPEDDGGTVSLRRDGRVKLDYPLRPSITEAMRAAHIALARLTLAAGAQRAVSLHHEPVVMTDPLAIQDLAEARYGAHEHAIFTAHQMGGCAMGPDPATSVVGVDHRLHGVPNLFVVDGSVLPTSLGVNPSQTIYGLAHRARDLVASAV